MGRNSMDTTFTFQITEKENENSIFQCLFYSLIDHEKAHSTLTWEKPWHLLGGGKGMYQNIS
jgi:hypothetical protein